MTAGGEAEIQLVRADTVAHGAALVDLSALADRCRDAGLAWHPLWDLEWIAGSASVTEVFLTGIELGARMSLGGVRDVFDAAVVWALAAAEEWTG